MPIPLRADFDARMMRVAAKRSKNGPQARRLRIHPVKAAGSAGESYSGCRIASDLSVSIALTRVRPR